MITQVAGINLATTSHWRYVFFISTGLALFQLLFAFKIVESPTFLLHKNRVEDHKIARKRLWGDTMLSLTCKRLVIHNKSPWHIYIQAEEALLNESDEDLDPEPSRENFTVPQLFAVNELRKPLMAVSFAMLAQQFCGKNSWLVRRVGTNECAYWSL